MVVLFAVEALLSYLEVICLSKSTSNANRHNQMDRDSSDI